MRKWIWNKATYCRGCLSPTTGRRMPSFGAASRADGDTRLGVSLRCIQDQERRCLVPCGQVIVHHLSRLFHCSPAAASLLLDEGASQISAPVCDLDCKTTSSSDKTLAQFFWEGNFSFLSFFFSFANVHKQGKKRPAGRRRWCDFYRGPCALPTRRSRSIGCKRCRLSKITRPEVILFDFFWSRINPESFNQITHRFFFPPSD